MTEPGIARLTSGWNGRHFYDGITDSEETFDPPQPYLPRYRARRLCDNRTAEWNAEWQAIYPGGQIRPGNDRVTWSLPIEDYESACWQCLVDAPLDHIVDPEDDAEDRAVARAGSLRAILRGLQLSVRSKGVSQRQLAVWVDRGVDRCIELLEGYL